MFEYLRKHTFRITLLGALVGALVAIVRCRFIPERFYHAKDFNYDLATVYVIRYGLTTAAMASSLVLILAVLSPSDQAWGDAKDFRTVIGISAFANLIIAGGQLLSIW